jgi:xylulokinase
MKIGGLDIGTTGCKLTVFDEKGRELGKAYRDYPARRLESGHELDAGCLIEGVFEVIREIAALHPDMGAIGVTSFGETFVMTDEAGRPLRTAMLYTDPRGAEEVAELSEKLGAGRIVKITGLAPHEMYSVGKLMWIKRHQPELFAAARRILLMEDYAVWSLTGNAQIDYSLATRTMAFDINTLTWSREIFDAAGIDLSLMSRLVPTGTVAGKITAEVAERTGLCKDCVVVSVSHDQVAAAAGAGVFDGEIAVDGAGTVQCLTPVYDSLPDVEVMAKGYFSVVPYVVPGKYAAYAFSYTGGALIKWCVDNLGGGRGNAELEQAYGKDGPTGLLVLPHFAGAATPYMDTGSRGAILGLTTETTAPEIYRACMEGVAYEMRLNYEALADSGIRFTRIRATGGGARSKVWMQMKADVLNMPVTALKTSDAGTVGSAMLTGAAIGVFKDLEEAAGLMVKETETFLPRQEMHDKYMKIYKRYKEVYRAVRPLMDAE